jgi:triacylglycerol lipase
MANYLKSVKGKSWTQLSDVPEQPYTVEAAIESWLKSKTPVDASSAAFWRWIDSALIYVLKKVAMTAVLSLQSAFIGTFTLADRIAYILAKGVSLADNVSIWVERLMRKIMLALHMKVVETKKELTHALIRYVLQRLTEKANREARDTLRKL